MSALTPALLISLALGVLAVALAAVARLVDGLEAAPPGNCDAGNCPSPPGQLTPFDNGKSYCRRCAEEIEAFGWAKPLKGDHA